MHVTVEHEYEYEKCPNTGVLFVAKLPARELEYRKEKDARPVEDDDAELDLPDPRTWAGQTIRAQLSSLERYARFATKGPDALPWLADAIAIFRWFLEAVRWDLAFPDDGPALRQGQRIVTAAGKVGCTYLRNPDWHDYLDGAEAPFATVQAPEGVDWLGDKVFAHLRLAGMNPNLVRVAQSVDDVAACAELDTVRRALDELLEQAVQERRMFVVPPEAFALLSDVAGTRDYEHPHRRRFVCAPTAVFVRDRASNHLRPLAIRCGEADRYRAIAFDEGERWMRAKLHYAVAEGTYQTYVSHQPQTHFFMEAVAIATRRALHDFPEHPLGAFLEPHIEGVMAVNAVSQGTLLALDSPFNEFIALDPRDVWATVGKAYDLCRTVPRPLEIPDLGAELCYPFREDYLALERCIRDWAQAFVRAHWGAADPLHDEAVTAWTDELRTGAGLHIGTIATARDLAELLGHIACIATIQHAAYHFPQSDLGRCVAITPLFAAEPPPGELTVDAKGGRQIPALDTLPDVHAAAWQGFVLSEAAVHWRTLGQLTKHPCITRARENPAVDAAAVVLDDALRGVETQIASRNETLTAASLPPYEYLLPSKRVICSPNT